MKNDDGREVESEETAILSLRTRLIVSIFFALLGAMALFPLLRYAFGYGAGAIEFKDLGLDKIGILSIAGIFVVNFPWVRLRTIFKKIGPVEFQEILSRQSNEQIQLSQQIESGLSELKGRVGQVEEALRKNIHAELKLSDGRMQIRQEAEGDQKSKQLEEMILGFLSDHKGWYFSTSRIESLAQKHKKYAMLLDYTHTDIKGQLQRLLLTNRVNTKISQKGNMLYGIKKH